MVEIKAVFFDLDGTLLTSTRGIAASTRLAISDLRRSGILVGIATGRGPAFALPLLEDLGLNFAVTYNGQYIVDAGHVLYENPLDKKLLRNIIRYAAENKRDISFGKADGISGSGLLKFGESRLAGFVAGLLPKSAANAARSLFKNIVRPFNPAVYDLRQIMKEPIYQIMMVATAKETGILAEKFSDLTVTRSSPYTADLISAGTSKLEGIRRIGQIYDFGLGETMVFGDSENDIAMISGAGLGVAMENAESSVKEVANYMTSSNNQDGIARALAYYGLVKFDRKSNFVSKDPTFNKVKEYYRLYHGQMQEVPRMFSAVQALDQMEEKLDSMIHLLYLAAGRNNHRLDQLTEQVEQHIRKQAEAVKVNDNHLSQDLLGSQAQDLIHLLYLTYESMVDSGIDPYELFELVHEDKIARLVSKDSNLGSHPSLSNQESLDKKIRMELDRQVRVALRRGQIGKEKSDI